MVSGNRSDDRNKQRRIALILNYDGTGFNGWQIQPEGRSVQSEIQKALKIILGSETPVVASGRTDTGVHALGQVIHFDAGSDIALSRLCVGMNGILPRDVSVRNAFDVPHDFNARFSAVEREYLYRIFNAPLRSPFSHYRAAWIARPLDEQFINRALSYCIGTHDFSSFCKMKSAIDQNTVRTVTAAECVRIGNTIEVTIRGNAFLHNMVRSLIGTVLELHKREMPAETMKSIITARDRRSGGETAPAYGLYLKRVTYNPPLEEMPSAFLESCVNFLEYN
jgi:tRNA pseudouridine38-40 synthase